MADAAAIQGLAGEIFSEGMETLCRMAQPGESWKDFNWNTPDSMIVASMRKNEKKALIGHSLGARRVLQMANKNLLDNVRVVICLDYVSSCLGQNDLVAPKNIPTYHFRSNDRRTRKLENALEIPVAPLNHIQMDDDQNVLRQIYDLIRKHTA